MEKIELNPYDLRVVKLDSGDECVQLNANIAFNEGFKEMCLAKGVKRYEKKEPKYEEED